MNLSDSKKLEEMREQHRQNPKLLAPKQALINGLEYHLAEQDREIAELREEVKNIQALGQECIDYQRRHRKWALKAAHNSFYLRCMWLSWFTSEKTRSRKAEDRVKAQDIVIAEYKADDYDEMQRLKEDNEFLNSRITQLTDFDYAVEREHLTSDIRRLEKRAEKAEAELVDVRRANRGMADIIREQEARVKELEELLGEETYAERAAVRHYKRIKELEAEIIEREKRERYLADSNAEFVELLPQKDERIKELEQELLWATEACEKAENLLAEKEKV